MKVGLFTDTYSQMNGVCVHVKNLAHCLDELGADVTVFTGSGKPSRASGEPSDFKVVNYPRIPYFPAKGYEVIFPKRLEKMDIYHSHSPYAVGWAGLAGGKKYRKPTLITSHTAPSHFFSMYRANFLEPLGWKYLVGFMNQFDRTVCQTHATERRFRDHGLSNPVTIASAGVDTGFWLGDYDEGRFRKKYGVEGDFAISVIRASPEKRPEFFLKACKELGIQAVLCSSGPMLEELKKKYPEAIFLGRLPTGDLRDAYHAAKVFALTSTDETEGLVAIEAMITNNAVIVSDLPCLREFVIDGKTGYTFSSYPDFRKKLKHLWEDGKFRNKVVREGKKEAKKRGIKESAKTLIRAYEEMLSEKNGRR